MQLFEQLIKSAGRFVDGAQQHPVAKYLKCVATTGHDMGPVGDKQLYRSQIGGSSIHIGTQSCKRCGTLNKVFGTAGDPWGVLDWKPLTGLDKGRIARYYKHTGRAHEPNIGGPGVCI